MRAIDGCTTTLCAPALQWKEFTIPAPLEESPEVEIFKKACIDNKVSLQRKHTVSYLRELTDLHDIQQQCFDSDRFEACTRSGAFFR